MNRIYARARRQERDGAGRHGGTANVMSGAGDTFKNDVRTPDTSIEFKGTAAASYRLRAEDLVRAWFHAVCANRRMVFGIEFFANGVTTYSPGVPVRWIVLPEDDYLDIKKRADAEEPTAEQVTLNTIRLWTEHALASSVAAEGYTTPAAYRSAGYEHAARSVLAILDMNGRPAHEPVVFR